jgi:hypothetical protein
MPIECVMSSISGDPIDAKPTIMLTTKITEQKKLQENILEVQTMWEPTSGADFFGVNRKILRFFFNLEIMSYGFPKEKKTLR